MAEAQAGAASAPDEPPEALLRRLEWTVLRRLDGLLQGDWRTLHRGQGIDLADLREYQFADDVRHIDWNVTARLQVPHVRQFTEDRQLTAWFLLDLSGSVNFGSAQRTKLDVSATFVAALARVLTRQGNRVGAVLYGQGVEAVIAPGASRTHVLQLLTRMRTPRPRTPPLGRTDAAASGSAARGRTTKGRPKDGSQAAIPASGTSLGELLERAEHTVRRRSLVVLVSDFISTPGWEQPLARLVQRHDVIAVRVLDPLEMALPEIGLVTVEDAETGEQLFIDSADPAFRARYEQIAQAEEARLGQSLAESGADTLELATDDDLVDALLRYVDLRRQRARLPASHRWPAAFRAPVDGNGIAMAPSQESRGDGPPASGARP